LYRPLKGRKNEKKPTYSTPYSPYALLIDRKTVFFAIFLINVFRLYKIIGERKTVVSMKNVI
jgi:hypothetical protein